MENTEVGGGGMSLVVVYESEDYRNFYPLTFLRTTFQLRVGAFRNFQRIQTVLKSKQIFYYTPRTSLLYKLEEYGNKYINPEDIKQKDVKVIFINGLLIFFEDIFANMEENTICISERDNSIVFAYVNLTSFPDFLSLLDGLVKNNMEKISSCAQSEINIIPLSSLKNLFFPRWIWEFVEINTEVLKQDAEIILGNGLARKVEGNIIFLGDAKIFPYTYIEGNEYLILEDGVKIKPFSIIETPGYIGENSVVDQGKIRKGVSLGKMVKVSGEVEESIIEDFSNKHHDGFIGHSYIGQWVNIGAMATTSDLKNTYGNVKIFYYGKVIETGILKLGSIIGDHTKIGIGVMLNTGTVVGLGCNIYFEGKLIKKFVPDFSWGGEEPFKRFSFDKFIETVGIVMNRRGVQLSPEDIRRLREVYDKLTNGEEP